MLLKRGRAKMQCTSHVPIYYYTRNVNVTANEFSWPIFNGNISHNSGRSYDTSLQPRNVDKYLGYGKEVMRQMMLEHEATFRLQVQELHRLYKRQKELMGEIREREISQQHLQKHTSESYPYLWRAGSDTTHQVSHGPSWLFGISSDTLKAGTGPSLTRNSSTELEALSSHRYGKKILDLELPADMSDDGKEMKQLEEGNTNETHDCDLKLDSKPTYSSSSNLICTKINCLIDLNEPVMLESLCSSSTGRVETDTSHMEIVKDMENFSGLIDLNSTPPGLSETTVNLENAIITEEETKPGDSDGREKSKPGVDDKLSTVNTEIDLNSGVTVDELSPVCEKSENSQLEKPPSLSEKDGESLVDLDKIVAETLIMISSEAHQLHWFAEIASSMGGEGLTDDDDRTQVSCDMIDEFMIGRPSKGTATGTKQHKDVDIEETVRRKDGSPKRGSRRRTASARQRKCSNRMKKSVSSILKQPASCSKHGFLESLTGWGNMKKRQGNRARKSCLLMGTE